MYYDEDVAPHQTPCAFTKDLRTRRMGKQLPGRLRRFSTLYRHDLHREARVVRAAHCAAGQTSSPCCVASLRRMTEMQIRWSKEFTQMCRMLPSESCGPVPLELCGHFCINCRRSLSSGHHRNTPHLSDDAAISRRVPFGVLRGMGFSGLCK